MARWDPWRGCHRISEGCRNCYIHKGDAKRGIDTDEIRKLPGFYAPVAQDKKGQFKIKSGQQVFVCFSSDFLIEEADEWRNECWEIIRKRSDLHFLFLTKRIHRLRQTLPFDWDDGYDNVTIGCSIENQEEADRRLPEFLSVPVKHRNIILQPMLGPIDLRVYLKGVELVVVGGESDKNARVFDYRWVLDIRNQCISSGIAFEFRQCGSNFLKDDRIYHLQVKDLVAQARKAAINWRPSDNELTE